MWKKSSSLLDAKKIRAKLASDRHRKQRRKHVSLDSLAGLDDMFQCIGRNAGRQREMEQQREIERQKDMERQSGIVQQQADIKPGCSIYQSAHKEMAAAGREQEDSLRASLLSCLRGIDFKPMPREYSMTYCLYRGENRVAVFHDKRDVQLTSIWLPAGILPVLCPSGSWWQALRTNTGFRRHTGSFVRRFSASAATSWRASLIMASIYRQLAFRVKSAVSLYAYI